MIGETDDTAAAQETATDPLQLNGETFYFDKLTYGERKNVAKIVKQLVVHAEYGDPNADPDEDWTGDDVRLAFAIVCARRANAEFSIEDGLKLTPAELEAPPTREAERS